MSQNPKMVLIIGKLHMADWTHIYGRFFDPTIIMVIRMLKE
jgi:hypothetical protein